LTQREIERERERKKSGREERGEREGGREGERERRERRQVRERERHRETRTKRERERERGVRGGGASERPCCQNGRRSLARESQRPDGLSKKKPKKNSCTRSDQENDIRLVRSRDCQGFRV
jgi:hypothetical protein